MDEKPSVYLDSFSALQRAEIAEIVICIYQGLTRRVVSVLFNEPKLLKFIGIRLSPFRHFVSVLFNEPKLLKLRGAKDAALRAAKSFSALQRAEIAEISRSTSRFTKS